MLDNSNLENEVFICMHCQKEFGVEEGTWPQLNFEQEFVMDADLNNRTREEFVCYDCLDKQDFGFMESKDYLCDD